MEFLTLNTGAQLPMIGFGTWDVRGEEGKRSILDALELGYRLVDTALMYKNHAIVGAALRESGLPRSELFLTTKLNRPCSSYPAAKAGIEQCLNELQTDYLDLLLIHEPYENALAMYQAMTEAVRSGKVRAIGISSFEDSRVIDLILTHRLVPAVNQIECHPFHQQEKSRSFLSNLGIVTEAWAPFAEGKHDLFQNEVLTSIGRKYGKSSAQVILRWDLQRGIIPLPKSVRKERMQQNLDIFDFTLTDSDMEAISKLERGETLFASNADPEYIKLIHNIKIH